MPLFKHFIAMIFACLLLSACKTLEIGVEHTSDPRASTAKVSPLGTAIRATELAAPAYATARALASITPSPTPTPEPFDPSVYVGLPQEKTFYWDDYTRVFFMRRSDEYGHYPNDPNQGTAWHYEEDRVEFPFDFQKLHHPRVVLTSEGDIDFGKQDASRQFVYMWNRLSQTQACSDDPVAQQLARCSPGAVSVSTFFDQLVEFDLTTRSQRVIWTREIPSAAYPEFWGRTQIDQVAGSSASGGRFLLLRLLDNDAEPSPPDGILVLNAETGKEKFLNLVGDVALDVRAQVVFYRNLLPFREKCDPSPGCELEGGYRIVYDPTGDVLSEPLP